MGEFSLECNFQKDRTIHLSIGTRVSQKASTTLTLTWSSALYRISGPILRKRLKMGEFSLEFKFSAWPVFRSEFTFLKEPAVLWHSRGIFCSILSGIISLRKKLKWVNLVYSLVFNNISL